MGFLSGLFTSVVEVALTPVAVVKDVVNIATGQDVTATKELLEDAGKNVSEAIDDLADGEVL